MILDFARPPTLSWIESIVIMAGLSTFIVVHLSGSSVAAELQAVPGQIKSGIRVR
jgi:hypothetical protein